MEKLLFPQESYAIRGACFEVYRQLGPGFLESVYQEALRIEFQTRKIPFIEHPQLNVYYKDFKLKSFYIPDFVCYNKIIVELKAINNLSEADQAQLINYLTITKYQLGFVTNFGSFPKVEILRYVC